MSSTLVLPAGNTPILGRVSNQSVAQIADTQPSELTLDRHGQLVVSPMLGQHSIITQRGRTFSANANDATGRTILGAGGTTSGFMFYNPVGSGVNMEIVELIVSPLTATDVVGVIGLEYGAPPTTVTNAATVRATNIGGNAQTALCKASYGSTIVAMTFLRWLPIFVQTVAGILQGSSVLYNPNGTLIIAPGGAVNIISSTTQSTNLWAQSVTWMEMPL